MWHKNYSCCRECGTTSKKHMADGLCNPCYQRRYRNTPDNKERISTTKKDWYLDRHKQQLAARKIRRERVHFDGKREAVLLRDGYACTRCGNTEQLTVHHKDRNGRGSSKPNNRLSNLETVCRACHLNEHRKETLLAKAAKHKMT